MKSLPFALSIRWITASVNMKKRRVVLVGDSLRGTEGLYVNHTHPTEKSAASLGPRYGILPGDCMNQFLSLLAVQDDCGDVDKRGT